MAKVIKASNAPKQWRTLSLELWRNLSLILAEVMSPKFGPRNFRVFVVPNGLQIKQNETNRFEIPRVKWWRQKERLESWKIVKNVKSHQKGVCNLNLGENVKIVSKKKSWQNGVFFKLRANVRKNEWNVSKINSSKTNKWRFEGWIMDDECQRFGNLGKWKNFLK